MALIGANSVEVTFGTGLDDRRRKRAAMGWRCQVSRSSRSTSRAAAEEQQRGEHQRVAGDYPLQARQAVSKAAVNRRKRNVGDLSSTFALRKSARQQ